MKKYLLLLILSVLVFAGCKKQTCRECNFYTYRDEMYFGFKHCGTDAEFDKVKKPYEDALIPGYNRMECK